MALPSRTYVDELRPCCIHECERAGHRDSHAVEVPTAARMSGMQTSESFDRVWANLAAVVGWLLLLSVYRYIHCRPGSAFLNALDASILRNSRLPDLAWATAPSVFSACFCMRVLY